MKEHIIELVFWALTGLGFFTFGRYFERKVIKHKYIMQLADIITQTESDFVKRAVLSEQRLFYEMLFSEDIEAEVDKMMKRDKLWDTGEKCTTK